MTETATRQFLESIKATAFVVVFLKSAGIVPDSGLSRFVNGEFT
jgi:hypothetical protein